MLTSRKPFFFSHSFPNIEMQKWAESGFQNFPFTVHNDKTNTIYVQEHQITPLSNLS